MNAGDAISVLSMGLLVNSSGGGADYPSEDKVLYPTVYAFGDMEGTFGTPAAPGDSALDAILAAIVLEHQTAALTVGGQSLTIVKRKIPKKEEGVDAPYQVTISGVQVPDKIRRIARGKYLVLYAIEMTLITPNDHDALTNLLDHTNWRESTRARYMAASPLPAVATVKRVDVVTGPFLDRAMLADGYDYDQIALNIWSYETR